MGFSFLPSRRCLSKAAAQLAGVLLNAQVGQAGVEDGCLGHEVEPSW